MYLVNIKNMVTTVKTKIPMEMYLVNVKNMVTSVKKFPIDLLDCEIKE